jgi:heme/copper-type cytochrome/quinol oxidase subunit 2
MKHIKTIAITACAFATAAANATSGLINGDSLNAMHAPLLWICGIVALAVLMAIVYSVARFRHADTVAAQAFEKRRLREFVWALVPMAIVIAAAAPAVRESSPQAMQAHRTGIRDLVADVEATRLPVTGNLEAPTATARR